MAETAVLNRMNHAMILGNTAKVYLNIGLSHKPADVMQRVKLAESMVEEAALVLEEAKRLRAEQLAALGMSEAA